MRTGLVLGGGGMVGIAYHAGVLRAVESELGLDAAGVDLIIGTSAGSLVGAYLRCVGGIGLLTQGIEGVGGAAPEPLPRAVDWAAADPMAWFRRMLGSAFVAARSVVRLPMPPLHPSLGKVFPAGLAAMAAGRERLRADLPERWPSGRLWMATVDIVSGQRVVLGRAPFEDRLRVPEAVRASCAIPVLYPPVAMGRRLLVDGGVHSMANTDLLAAPDAQIDAALCVLPMGYDPVDPPAFPSIAVRRFTSFGIDRELATARRAGVATLVVRPAAAMVRIQGRDMMRTEGLHEVLTAAYDDACRQLTAAVPSAAAFRERVAAA